MVIILSDLGLQITLYTFISFNVAYSKNGKYDMYLPQTIKWCNIDP